MSPIFRKRKTWGGRAGEFYREQLKTQQSAQKAFQKELNKKTKRERASVVAKGLGIGALRLSKKGTIKLTKAGYKELKKRSQKT